MNVSTGRKNLVLSPKNTFFRRPGKVMFGYYLSQFIHNSQTNILKEYQHCILKVASGAILNVLNNYTWNEIKDNYICQLKTSTFVLSTASNTKLQSQETVKLNLYTVNNI